MKLHVSHQFKLVTFSWLILLMKHTVSKFDPGKRPTEKHFGKVNTSVDAVKTTDINFTYWFPVILVILTLVTHEILFRDCCLNGAVSMVISQNNQVRLNTGYLCIHYRCFNGHLCTFSNSLDFWRFPHYQFSHVIIFQTADAWKNSICDIQNVIDGATIKCNMGRHIALPYHSIKSLQRICRMGK